MSIRYSVDLDELKFRHSFSENGYIVVEDVFSSDEVNEMRDAMAQIVATINPEVGPKATFTTYDEDKHLSDQYFLDSVDNISHFYEEGKQFCA
jgi:ectoine hydroxylase-related dioxygenase (phytanoyl-CoA dioxygenase family)